MLVNREEQEIKRSIILLLIAVLAFGGMLVAGCSSQGASSSTTTGEAPTCPENIAMLQSAVDKYKVDTGVFPATLQQLIEDNAKNWKGPYVNEIPACPAGGVYKVTPDGRVTE